MSLTFSKVVVGLHNQLHFLDSSLPAPLNKFALCQNYPLDQVQQVLTG
jgi:hypothetical protein